MGWPIHPYKAAPHITTLENAKGRFFLIYFFYHIFCYNFYINWWTCVELQFYAFLFLFLIFIAHQYFLIESTTVSITEVPSTFTPFRGVHPETRFSEAHPEQVGTIRQSR